MTIYEDTLRMGYKDYRTIRQKQRTGYSERLTDSFQISRRVTREKQEECKANG